jgi:hypothetical protein
MNCQCLPAAPFQGYRSPDLGPHSPPARRNFGVIRQAPPRPPTRARPVPSGLGRACGRDFRARQPDRACLGGALARSDRSPGKSSGCRSASALRLRGCANDHGFHVRAARRHRSARQSRRSPAAAQACRHRRSVSVRPSLVRPERVYIQYGPRPENQHQRPSLRASRGRR